MEVINKIGRRKTAVARIYMKKGSGQITVNNRDYKEYFPIATLQYVVTQSLQIAGVDGEYDIKANLDGGGMSGQAEALRLAISRALVEIDPEIRPALKSKGLMRRDPRMVERKKPGQPKARKRFQFSKR
ncbi:30S ribosomal protein S9 [Bacteroidales bacterium OttesenSCG-928-B11]|nr:30S ribosomal protein S9 [Bacteroidales bacterium OttesenSCG-928-C03]MDL2313174.1 30S ribosomal protein S9 [Bacteroidales bacterium OttesenSCG-928-B11]MDL2326227.1 30S ribosomal protein S9 [Bacteroidales bacterium OttesenSCG-928-A14]